MCLQPLASNTSAVMSFLASRFLSCGKKKMVEHRLILDPGTTMLESVSADFLGQSEQLDETEQRISLRPVDTSAHYNDSMKKIVLCRSDTEVRILKAVCHHHQSLWSSGN